MLKLDAPIVLSMLLMSWVSFDATTAALAGRSDRLTWVIGGVLYVLSTVAVGAFFYWLTRNVTRLRASEHLQSNAMTEALLLLHEIHTAVVRRPSA